MSNVALRKILDWLWQGQWSSPKCGGKEEGAMECEKWKLNNIAKCK